MKTFPTTLMLMPLMISSASFAANAGNGELTPQQIRQRFMVTAEVFVFDAAGKKILAKMPETRVMKTSSGKSSGPLTFNWASRSGLFDGLLAMKSTWEIRDNNTIKAKFVQYVSHSEQPKENEDRYAKEIKSEERDVSLMESVTWVSANNHNGKTVVVRYTPNIVDDLITDISAVNVVGVDTAIVDNTGLLWADHLSFDGKYLGITTHRGTVLISYYPFPDAKEIGIASENRMELTLTNNVVLSMISKSVFLPGGTSGKVYGRYLPERKSESLNSSHIGTSNQEDKFLNHLLHQKASSL